MTNLTPEYPLTEPLEVTEGDGPVKLDTQLKPPWVLIGATKTYLSDPSLCKHSLEDGCTCVYYQHPGKGGTWTRKYGWFTCE